MASGVAVSELCMQAHDDIKVGKKHRYVIFAVNKDLTEIEPIKKADVDCTYDDFIQELKDAEAEGQSRYGIYDCHFTLPNGQERKRLCMVFWNPDSAPVKQKMVYSSSKDAFKKKIKFTGKDYQANDDDDLKFDNFLDFMKKHEVSQ